MAVGGRNCRQLLECVATKTKENKKDKKKYKQNTDGQTYGTRTCIRMTEITNGRSGSASQRMRIVHDVRTTRRAAPRVAGWAQLGLQNLTHCCRAHRIRNTMQKLPIPKATTASAAKMQA